MPGPMKKKVELWLSKIYSLSILHESALAHYSIEPLLGKRRLTNCGHEEERESLHKPCQPFSFIHWKICKATRRRSIIKVTKLLRKETANDYINVWEVVVVILANDDTRNKLATYPDEFSTTLEKPQEILLHKFFDCVKLLHMLKVWKIYPVDKRESRADATNYRPIYQCSLLSEKIE